MSYPKPLQYRLRTNMDRTWNDTEQKVFCHGYCSINTFDAANAIRGVWERADVFCDQDRDKMNQIVPGLQTNDSDNHICSRKNRSTE